jgi:hypothetical protein
MWGGGSTWGSAFLEGQEFQGILLFIAITLTVADDDKWSDKEHGLEVAQNMQAATSC